MGNGLIFLQQRRKILEWFAECISIHGLETLLVTVPSLPAGVIISDPDNLDFVFRHEHVFEKGRFFTTRLWDLFGDGILNTDGDLWKQQRQIGATFLAPASVSITANIELPILLTKAVGELRGFADGRTVVDMETVVHEITTQLMGKMTYGTEMHTNDDFTLAFNHASSELAKRFQNPVWFVTEKITGIKLRASIRTIKACGTSFVSRAKTDKSGRHHISTGFINSLSESLGDEALVADAALNFFSAGRDTVAQALTWAFYLLLQHPDVGDTLFQAIKQKSANEDSQSNPYIMAVFYESLRLYPPLPLDTKQARQDTTLPDGTFLPKGSIVLWSTWAMNRSGAIWGADAVLFRPERWLVDGKLRHKKPSEFPVFQGGPRMCLGRRLAEAVFVQVVTAIWTAFEISPAYQGERCSKTHLTMPMSGGLPTYLKIRRR